MTTATPSLLVLCLAVATHSIRSLFQTHTAYTAHTAHRVNNCSNTKQEKMQGDATAESEMASEALSVLTDQVFSNLKLSTPPLEDLLKIAVKYQGLMEQASQAASAFVEAMGKVAVTASRARGATAELGQALQKVVAKHHSIASEQENQARKMNEQVCLLFPLFLLLILLLLHVFLSIVL